VKAITLWLQNGGQLLGNRRRDLNGWNDGAKRNYYSLVSPDLKSLIVRDFSPPNTAIDGADRMGFERNCGDFHGNLWV
jgi:hypothetical protein